MKFENFYKFVNYKHVNMLSISNASKIIGLYEYTASIDLTDAFVFYSYTFYSSKISKIYSSSLISIIACMSNGYGPAVRVFTKVS